VGHLLLYYYLFNPSVLRRAHRLGQEKAVLIFRLVALGMDESSMSVDEFIIRKAQRKLATEQRILSQGRFNNLSASDGALTTDAVALRKSPDDDWWFHEEDESTSVESLDSVDKLLSTFFARKEEKVERNYILDFSSSAMVNLFSRTFDQTEFFNAVITHDCELDSTWEYWLSQLNPSSGVEIVNAAFPKKRRTEISFDRVR
jgi:hypothetical protein